MAAPSYVFGTLSPPSPPGEIAAVITQAMKDLREWQLAHGIDHPASERIIDLLALALTQNDVFEFPQNL